MPGLSGLGGAKVLQDKMEACLSLDAESSQGLHWSLLPGQKKALSPRPPKAKAPPGSGIPSPLCACRAPEVL